jgi:hypothetical protein
VLVLATGSLLGLILIVGALGAVAVVAGVDVIEAFARFLSTGSFRRWSG